LNIASALIKRVLETSDGEIWNECAQHYFPPEYSSLYKIINKHYTKFHAIPTFEELSFEIRDAATKETLFAVQAVDVDVETSLLLHYLKNEYTQAEILESLDSYVENTVAFEDAEESVEELHQIVMDIEAKVDLQPPAESMQRIQLFETEEEYSRYVTLGLNADFDIQHQFTPKDLILVGGFRGSGKSLTCNNIAVNMFNTGKSSITYSTEMDKRVILRRMCSISTGIDASKIRGRNLNVTEWNILAAWWASRFADSNKVLNLYKDHKSFDKFHSKLTSSCELLPEQQLDVVYDPNLTIGKIQADLDKKMKRNMNVGIIIIDYLNKVKLNITPSKRGAFDWMEQIEISSALKNIAKTYECPVFAPFQTTEGGAISFAKGILIDADAGYILKAYEKSDRCITFENIKMRDGPDISFTSVMNWSSLKMGPESALTPEDKEAEAKKTGESIEDL